MLSSLDGMLFFNLYISTPAKMEHLSLMCMPRSRGTSGCKKRRGAYFAGSFLLADLALLISLVPLMLFKLADELRAMLLNQTHLDGTMVGL